MDTEFNDFLVSIKIKLIKMQQSRNILGAIESVQFGTVTGLNLGKAWIVGLRQIDFNDYHRLVLGYLSEPRDEIEVCLEKANEYMLPERKFTKDMYVGTGGRKVFFEEYRQGLTDGFLYAVDLFNLFDAELSNGAIKFATEHLECVLSALKDF